MTDTPGRRIQQFGWTGSYWLFTEYYLNYSIIQNRKPCKCLLSEHNFYANGTANACINALTIRFVLFPAITGPILLMLSLLKTISF